MKRGLKEIGRGAHNIALPVSSSRENIKERKKLFYTLVCLPCRANTESKTKGERSLTVSEVSLPGVLVNTCNSRENKIKFDEMAKHRMDRKHPHRQNT